MTIDTKELDAAGLEHVRGKVEQVAPRTHGFKIGPTWYNLSAQVFNKGELVLFPPSRLPKRGSTIQAWFTATTREDGRTSRWVRYIIEDGKPIPPVEGEDGEPIDPETLPENAPDEKPDRAYWEARDRRINRAAAGKVAEKLIADGLAKPKEGTSALAAWEELTKYIERLYWQA